MVKTKKMFLKLVHLSL